MGREHGPQDLTTLVVRAPALWASDLATGKWAPRLVADSLCQPRPTTLLCFGQRDDDWALREDLTFPKSGESLALASICSELFPVGVWREHTDGSG